MINEYLYIEDLLYKNKLFINDFKLNYSNIQNYY